MHCYNVVVTMYIATSSFSSGRKEIEKRWFMVTIAFGLYMVKSFWGNIKNLYKSLFSNRIVS